MPLILTTLLKDNVQTFHIWRIFHGYTEAADRQSR